MYTSIFCSVDSYAITEKQYLEKATPYLPLLDSLINKHWPDATCKHFLAGQIEQETCANLNKCWNSNTELKTDREYGFGLGQITIAYRKNGTVRFNNFEEAKRKYSELANWSWDNRFNIRYQLIYMIMEMRAGYNSARKFSGDIQKWAVALVTYNAGAGAILTRLAVCKQTPSCDCTTWFDGLDKVHAKDEEVLLYGKELYKRRNEYPNNIISGRSLKYEPYF